MILTSAKTEFGGENYDRSKLGRSNRKNGERMDESCVETLTSSPFLKLI